MSVAKKPFTEVAYKVEMSVQILLLFKYTSVVLVMCGRSQASWALCWVALALMWLLQEDVC